LGPKLRFLGWVGVALLASAVLAPNLPSLLSQALNDTFGSVFPAIPFGALLSVLFLLRWKDLEGVLAREQGLTAHIGTRLVGLTTIAVLLVARPITNQSVELAGIAVILAFYGTSLAINPLTRRLMLPYAMIYAAGVGLPSVLQWGVGEPLANASTAASAEMASLFGLPVTWTGTQFSILSKTGDLVTGAVTPGCSSIISITTFLGLLGLMHIDMEKDAHSTIKLALAGVAALVALNSVRIALLLWVGYTSGAAAFWGIHNWIGYGLFLGFYLAALVAYSRMGARRAGTQGLTSYSNLKSGV
jgi:exosortase/archaeosortase family protein